MKSTNARVCMLAAFAISSLVACDESPVAKDNLALPESGTASTVGQGTADTSVAWFDGSVADAFAHAKSADKPLFLYWSALWCPPCQEIKHTVFKEPRFINQSALFVPVYLDGDTAQAQAWGERFGVQGYPTMIVFNSAGHEVTRIPGGIDVTAYSVVLQTALERLTPVADLLLLALDDPQKLNTADLQLLAWYSWGQDNSALPENTDILLFHRLANAARATDPKAAARLDMQYLRLAAEAAAVVDPGAEAERGEGSARGTLPPEAVRALRAVLADDALTLACWDTIAYGAGEVLSLVPANKRSALAKAWTERALALRHDLSLTIAEQLGGWFPRLEVHFEDASAPALPDADVALIRADLKRADEATRNPYARISVVSQMGSVLQYAHLYDEAAALLEAELARSGAPWYFMSSLANLAEDRELIDEAIAWRRKSWEAAKGPATRLQWGASYARTLIRLTPANDTLILATAEALLDESPGAEELFAGRNFRTLRRLRDALGEWHDDPVALNTFNSRLAALCGSGIAGDGEQQVLARSNCTSLNLQIASAAGPGR